MGDAKNKVTILVSNFSKAPRVVENVRDLLRQETDFDFKVFVTDNSCNEEQRKILREGLRPCPEVGLFINSQNLGYSKGHNVIRGKEVGDYIFIVNPDILFKEKDTLQKMVDYMDENPDIAILGPQQINDNGEIAMTVRAFPKFYIQVARRTFLRYLPIIKEKVAYDEMKHLDYSQIQDVDWLQSSCVIIRRDFWEKVGGYNEYYFLFMADTEMCVKAWEMGYRVVYFPKTRVYADGKRISEGGLKDFFNNWIIRQHVIDSIKYRLKYFWKGNSRDEYYRKHSSRNQKMHESI
jgi:GT2 family glycosyltransferase